MISQDVKFGSIGARIKSKRIAKGMTQLDLATKAGNVSRGHISLIERDATHVTAHLLRGMCMALNVSSDEILYGYKAPVTEGLTDKSIEEVCLGSKGAMKGLHQAVDRELVLLLFEMVNTLGPEKTAQLVRPESQLAMSKMNAKAFGSFTDYLLFSG